MQAQAMPGLETSRRSHSLAFHHRTIRDLCGLTYFTFSGLTIAEQWVTPSEPSLSHCIFQVPSSGVEGGQTHALKTQHQEELGQLDILLQSTRTLGEMGGTPDYAAWPLCGSSSDTSRSPKTHSGRRGNVTGAHVCLWQLKTLTGRFWRVSTCDNHEKQVSTN